ncbi:MAG: hypothetical protein PHP59_05625 [Methanofollis sp.]|uniref:hypothetical protein n=1 Tax=Methanofollis sp. TaxID=2052835 RepID=UPI00260FE62E|nr:hypothetical protein [Methanofollis sp.]MDD4254841.1 hypothetical protein [Methanofollis sp.]
MHTRMRLQTVVLLLLPALLAAPALAQDAVPSFPLVNLTPFGNDSALNATPADYRAAATPQELLRVQADARGHGAKGEAQVETTYLVLTADDLAVLLLFAGILAVCCALVRRFGR